MDITSLLGDDAASLLEHQCSGISKEHMVSPGPDFIDRVMVAAQATWPRPCALRSSTSVLGARV